MENFEQVLKEAIQPYLDLILDLKQKNQQQESEIITLKYAILEMDRKFQEIEKKAKPQIAKVKAQQSKTLRTQSQSKQLNRPSSRQGKIGGNDIQDNNRARSKTPSGRTPFNNQLGKKDDTGNQRSNSKTKGNEFSSSQSNILKNKFSKTINQKTNQLHNTSNNSISSNVKGKIQQNVSQKINSRNSSNQRNISKKSTKQTNLEEEKIFKQEGVYAKFGNLKIQVYPKDIQNIQFDQDLEDMQLKQVLAYNGQRCKNNLFYIEENVILYSASKYILFQNIQTNEQQILSSHTDEIQCMAINKEQQLLCTGQKMHPQEQYPILIIWDLSRRSVISKVQFYQKNIQDMIIDESGIYLITFGGLDKVIMTVWNIKELVKLYQNKQLIQGAIPLCEYPLPKFIINSVKINKFISNYNTLYVYLATNQEIKSYIINTIQKTIEENKNLNIYISQSTYQLEFNQNQIYISMENGLIQQFQDNQIKQFKTCDQVIPFIGFYDQQTLYTVSQNQNFLQLWNQNFQETNKIEIIDLALKQQLGIEHIDLKLNQCDFHESIFLLGYSNNLLIQLQIKENQTSRQIIQFSPSDQIGQICCFPKSKSIAVVSKDQFIRFYQYSDPSKPSFMNSIYMQNSMVSLDIQQQEAYLCIGYDKGMFEVFKIIPQQFSYQLESIKVFDLGRENEITCVKFSPNSRFLIMSCFKDIVVFNSSNEDFEQEGLLKGNKNKVLTLQFDMNSQFAMSNAEDGQVISWEMSGKFRKVDNQETKDLEWHSKSGIYQWDVQSAWTNQENIFVNQISVCKSMGMVAIADNSNQVRIMNFPAFQTNQTQKTIEESHPYNCKCVQFSPDELMLVSTGTLDLSINIYGFKNLVVIGKEKNKDIEFNQSLEDIHVIQNQKNISNKDDENLLND